MKYWIFMSLSICGIILTQGRLITKTTCKSLVTQTTSPSSPIRVSRHAFYEDGVGYSKEDPTEEEGPKPCIRKERYSLQPTNEAASDIIKGEAGNIITKKLADSEDVQNKPKKTLIKKPVPKFYEVDNEDFQGKIIKSPIKYADSGDHEDEDFNLDDYEFDVNHDEFIGRGKPLEPRTKHKACKPTKNKKRIKSKTTVSPPKIKIQSKVLIPAEQSNNIKKKIIIKKETDKMKEDYYDDVFTTTKIPKAETIRDLDEDISEETDDSKDIPRKGSVRQVRSPWLTELLKSKIEDKINDLNKAFSGLATALPN